jgi:hypothetical protein
MRLTEKAYILGKDAGSYIQDRQNPIRANLTEDHEPDTLIIAQQMWRWNIAWMTLIQNGAKVRDRDACFAAWLNGLYNSDQSTSGTRYDVT